MKEALQGIGSIQQGIAAKSAGKYTRKVMRQNERNALNDGVEQSDRIRTAARIAMGRQLVAQGSSGFEMGTGSALDSLFESQVEREIDLATVRRQSKMKGNAYRQDGDLAYAQGKSAFYGGLISGAASFAEGAQKLASMGAGGGGQ
jgi:hypothetical protein